MKPIAILPTLCTIVFLSACQLTNNLDPDAQIATGVAQTLEVAGYQTQIAAANPATATSTPISDSLPTETANPQPESCPAPSGSPSPAELDFPAELGGLEESGGQLLLNDEPVLVYYANDDACQREIWLSLASAPDWPLMIRDADGLWQAGAKAWQGQLVLINTSELDVQVALSADLGGFGGQEIELAPDELFDLSAIPPGSYTLTFLYADYAAECRIAFSNASNYLFSIIEIGVAVLEESFEPQNSNEVNILSSPLCAP